MANTTTDLERDSYVALDVVSREITGLILSCGRNSSADAAAINETVRGPVAPDKGEPEDWTPSMSIPGGADEAIGNVGITITDQKKLKVGSWTGEEGYAMDKAGPGMLTIRQQQLAQTMRSFVNYIEKQGLTLGYKRSSRAFGTAGTTPFGTAGDWSDLAQGKKILKDNGAPMSELMAVLSTAASANIEGKQSQVQMSGDRNLLTQGIIDFRDGFAIRDSVQMPLHTKGTGASYQLNLAAGYAIGSETFAVDTGSGTILAGDVLTNTQSGRDANKYIVRTALGSGSLVLNDPGNRVAWVDNDTVAVGNSYTPNLLFARSAIVLATRVPKFPDKDAAVEWMIISDPVTGLSFMLRGYAGEGMVVWNMYACWGWAVSKSDWIATVLG